MNPGHQALTDNTPAILQPLTVTSQLRKQCSGCASSSALSRSLCLPAVPPLSGASHSSLVPALCSQLRTDWSLVRRHHRIHTVRYLIHGPCLDPSAKESSPTSYPAAAPSVARGQLRVESVSCRCVAHVSTQSGRTDRCA